MGPSLERHTKKSQMNVPHVTPINRLLIPKIKRQHCAVFFLYFTLIQHLLCIFVYMLLVKSHCPLGAYERSFSSHFLKYWCLSKFGFSTIEQNDKYTIAVFKAIFHSCFSSPTIPLNWRRPPVGVFLCYKASEQKVDSHSALQTNIRWGVIRPDRCKYFNSLKIQKVDIF